MWKDKNWSFSNCLLDIAKQEKYALTKRLEFTAGCYNFSASSEKQFDSDLM